MSLDEVVCFSKQSTPEAPSSHRQPRHVAAARALLSKLGCGLSTLEALQCYCHGHGLLDG